MKNNNTYKIALHIIALLIALMTLLALVFTLSKPHLTGYYYGSLGDTDTENGFTMMGFSSSIISSSYVTALIIIGLLCWVQFLFSLAAIVISIVSIFTFKESAAKFIRLIVVVGGLVLTFLYMIEGIAVTSVSNSTYSFKSFSTLAYIPFIINTLFAAAYIYCCKLFKDKLPISESDTFTFTMPDHAEGETIANDKVDSYILSYRSYVPDEKVAFLRDVLLKSSAESYSLICTAPLKNPTTILLISIFLGGLGIDRFLIGDTGIGVAKLLLSGLTFGIWPLIDIFLCYKKVKENNLNEILKRVK